MPGSRLSPASPMRLVEACKCGAIRYSPQPAIHVAASSIGVSRCYPPTCPIALELMKGTRVRTLLKTHPSIFLQLFNDTHERKNKHGSFHLRSLQNIMEDAVTHHACMFRGLHKNAHARHKGSPQCARMEKKEPDCAIVTVLLRALCCQILWHGGDTRVRRQSTIRTFFLHPSQPSPSPPWPARCTSFTTVRHTNAFV